MEQTEQCGHRKKLTRKLSGCISKVHLETDELGGERGKKYGLISGLKREEASHL